jgi:hypothetical protein
MEPKDFYFQLVHQASGSFFLITPKTVYDLDVCLSDESGVADEILPDGFYELTESTYEFDGDLERGRQLLIGLGLKEIDFGFNNPVEPVQGGDEDYDEEYREEDEEDLDELLKGDPLDKAKTFDLPNISTDKLLRHHKMMVLTESFEEAAKIRDELHSRGIMEF